MGAWVRPASPIKGDEMYIAPNTTIYLLKGVPLKSDYNETFWWLSEHDQYAYFSSKIFGQYLSQSYQRADREYCRIEAKYNAVFTCNYLMFRNVSHENKWFYAFINDITYINENVVEIDYTIDVMQTWFYSIETHPCFIERQSSYFDDIGDNLVPENIELGEYVSNVISDLPRTGILNDYSIVAFCTVKKDTTRYEGVVAGGVYSGLTPTAFNFDGSPSASGIPDLKTFIDLCTTKWGEDFMVALVLVPSAFIPQSWYYSESGDPTDEISVYETALTAIPKTTLNGLFDTYEPHNNKLYTYPYNFLYVFNTDGDSARYMGEYFDGSDIVFRLYGTSTANPEACLIPMDYKGVHRNLDERITMKVGTQCSWATDSFKAWLAYSTVEIPKNMLSTMIPLSNPKVPSLASGVDAVLNTMTQTFEAAWKPSQYQGTENGGVMVASRDKDFFFYRKRITSQFARIIDGYFDRYGYAVHTIADPNLHARAKWTYIKTIGCDFTGDIPVAHMEKIRKIFDAGVAIWWDTANIGNYTQYNAPLGHH